MKTTQNPRLAALNLESAPSESQESLAAVEGSLGRIPNIFGTMAHSPATLQWYLESGQTLSKGLFSGKEQEVIALAVAQENDCAYCLSAHTAIGKMQGMTAEQMQSVRKGEHEEAAIAALARLAQVLVRERGHASEESVQAFFDAGWTQAHLVELVAQVARNLFTNYFNHLMGTEVDFPAAPTLS